MRSHEFSITLINRSILQCAMTGFGIKNQNIKNPGVTGLIELAHCFYPKGLGPSGEPYFARHGFAGASRQWNCPVFGTGVFFDREVPERWPTGVMWNQGNISTTDSEVLDESGRTWDEFYPTQFRKGKRLSEFSLWGHEGDDLSRFFSLLLLMKDLS